MSKNVLIMDTAVPGSPKTYLRSWTAPLFAAGLSAITLVSFWLIKPHSYEAGFPAFFCFLPMAFTFWHGSSGREPEANL